MLVPVVRVRRSRPGLFLCATSRRTARWHPRVRPHPPDRQTNTLFYNVGPLGEFGKLDIIALGSTPAEAEQALLLDFPRLLGL